MNLNYLKISFRSLRNNRGFTAINILGLAVGMAAAILIMLWVDSEMGYDRFYTDTEDIYAVGNTDRWGSDTAVWFATPKPMSNYLASEYPEVEKVSRVMPADFLLTVGEIKLNSVKGSFVDSSFLEIFDFKVLSGAPTSTLRDPKQIVISSSLAENLFSGQDPIGSTIKIDNADVLTVGAVIEDIPDNSFMNGNFYILPWKYLEHLGRSDDYWGNNSVQTYIRLQKGTDIDLFRANIRGFLKRHTQTSIENVIQPISERWLYSSYDKSGKPTNSRIGMVRAFILIAGFILLIACINFMNLSTAQSEKRAKEVGVRKVVGARRGSLIGQFLTESTIVSVTAGMISLLLVFLSLPFFNDLVSRKLEIQLGSSSFWATFFCFVALTSILAGSYPAFYLSSFQPIKTLKGKTLRLPGKVRARKILVVFQFSISIVLIITTLFLMKQIHYAQDRETGYVKDRLVNISDQGNIKQNHNLIKAALIEQGIASDVSRSSHPFTNITSFNPLQWSGRPEGDNTIFMRMAVDDGIVATGGLELIAGRDFDLSRFPTDSSAALINEEALKIFGFEDPIGKSFNDNGMDWNIIGVVKNFVVSSPFDPISPLVIKGEKAGTNTTNVRLNENIAIQDALRKMEGIFKKFNPEYPFDFQFVDEAYAAKFKQSQQFGRLSALFTLLTIFISCLGLFGLAAFIAESRVKEIGIRKVLGASIINITRMLSGEFVKMVLISCLISFPIAYLVSDKVLSSYSYRIGISWEIFAVSGITSLAITLLTISYQSIKAAYSNPIVSLRDE